MRRKDNLPIGFSLCRLQDLSLKWDKESVFTVCVSVLIAESCRLGEMEIEVIRLRHTCATILRQTHVMRWGTELRIRAEFRHRVVEG